MGRRGKWRGWVANKENQGNYRTETQKSTDETLYECNVSSKRCNDSKRIVSRLVLWPVWESELRKFTTKCRRKSDVGHSIPLLTPLLRIPFLNNHATRNFRFDFCIDFGRNDRTQLSRDPSFYSSYTD